MQEKVSLSRRSFVKIAAVGGATTALLSTRVPSSALAEDSGSLPSNLESIQRIRTACRGCGKMECGVWVTVQNGRAVKIEGDETAFQSYGNCCTKSQASVQAAYHPDRLQFPMKRTNPKGEDPGWVRITWDEALSTAAQKLNELADRYGGESIFTMCGTSRIWCMSSANGLQKFWNSPNTHQAYQICKGPRHVSTGLVSGNAYSWMATVDRPKVYVQWGGASELSNYDDSCRTTVDVAMRADKHIVVDPRQTNLGKEAHLWNSLRPGTDAAVALSWGNVIIENELYDDLYVKRWTDAPMLVCMDVEPTDMVFSNRDNRMIKTRLLKESDMLEGGSPTKLVVWDELNSRFTYFDASTGLWEGEVRKEQYPSYEAMQENLVPGVAQGRVIEKSEFDPPIDPALYGEFEITLKDGTEHTYRPVWEFYAERCAEYSPEIAESITGVPADILRESASVYATPIDPATGYGNGGIQYMLATEHAANSVQNVRCIDALVGITGNFDTPAGHRGATKGTFGGQFAMSGPGFPTVTSEQWDKILGVEDIPLLRRYTIWADSTAIWDAANEGTPYALHGCINQSGDHMNMSNALWAWEGLKKLDFMMQLDLWHAPTSQMADILLPVRHWLEVDSPRICQGSGGAEGANCKCIAPLAETWYDVDIVIQFAKACGIPWSKDENDPWPDSIYALNSACESMGLTWEEYKQKFQEEGWVDCKVAYPDTWGTYRRYENGSMRSDKLPGLEPPTLKHEIWSTLMETYHPDGGWELPTFTEPAEGPVADPELAKEYPLIMTTGRRIPVYFHSEHRQLPWCRELWPVPRVEINPITASEYGIEQGDWVWIETKRGKIREVADFYYGIDPGVINCEHQWWLPEFSSATKGFDLININCLVNKDIRDPHCGSSYARAYNVKIYKATPENSPFNNPVPCDEDGTEMITSSDDPRLKEWLPTYEGRE